MKKNIIAVLIVLCVIFSNTVFAAPGIDASVMQDGSNPVFKIDITITEATRPTAVTISAKDENGNLSYFDIVMTDNEGDAKVNYKNLGKSGDYTFYFSVPSLNLEETVTVENFKGTDYWERFLENVSKAAKNGDSSTMQSLIITDGAEDLGINLENYDALDDKEAVFKAMSKNCIKYTSQVQLLKEFYAAVMLCGYNASKSAAALESIYLQEETLNLFDLYTSIPKDEDGKIVLDTLSEEERKDVYEQIVEEGNFEKASDVTTAFVLHTLTGAIKNADHYATVKAVLKAYDEAELIDLDIKSSDFDKVSKAIMRESYDTFEDVEDAANKAAKKSSSGGSSGGGGGGGSAVQVIVPSVTPEPITDSQTQTDDEYKSGEMQFSDMEDSKWALDAVNLLYKEGVVSGNGENKFEPNRFVTRAEMAKMAVDAAKLVKTADGPDFADVSENDWSYLYIKTACREGIFVGRGENMFESTASITRAEAAVVIYRMVKDKLTMSNEPLAFEDDANISDWAKDAVYTLKDNGIMNGRSSTEFCPGEVLTRAEAAVLFSKIIKYFV